MPELPEVETLRRDLIGAGLLGRRILDVDVLWNKTVQGMPEGEFRSRVAGSVIRSLKRRGKYLWFELDAGASLLMHLRMTGGLSLSAAGSADPHDRVVFHLDKGRLVFHDTRKFGRLLLTADPGEVLDRLGPEPLDPELTPALFHARLTGRRRLLKSLLLDQGFLAGLGNIYADESLFAAGLHPLSRSDSLEFEESRRLLESIRTVLEKSIDNRGTSLGDGESNFSSGGNYGRNALHLQVFRRTGMPCPRCGRPIERIIVGQRSTHLCSNCQVLPR